MQQAPPQKRGKYTYAFMTKCTVTTALSNARGHARGLTHTKPTEPTDGFQSVRRGERGREREGAYSELREVADDETRRSREARILPPPPQRQLGVPQLLYLILPRKKKSLFVHHAATGHTSGPPLGAREQQMCVHVMTLAHAHDRPHSSPCFCFYSHMSVLFLPVESHLSHRIGEVTYDMFLSPLPSHHPQKKKITTINREARGGERRGGGRRQGVRVVRGAPPIA